MKNLGSGTISEKVKQRKLLASMLKGLRGKCPSCGQGKLFKSYLKVRDTCDQCAEELYHHRADDAPAYFTIFIVGHLVVGAILLTEQIFAPETWVHLTVWLPLTVLLCLWLLPLVKGALIAFQWGLRLHGFGTENTQGADIRYPKIE